MTDDNPKKQFCLLMNITSAFEITFPARNIQQEAEAAWKLTTIKKNLTGESNFWIDFRTMRS